MAPNTLRTSFPTQTPACTLFKFANEPLSIPCAVAIETLSEPQIRALINDVQSKLNTMLFRDVDLLMEVYRELKAELVIPRRFRYHVYLRLSLEQDGNLRIRFDNRPIGHDGAGGTVYDLNQFNMLLRHLCD